MQYKDSTKKKIGVSKVLTSRRYCNPCWEVLFTQLQWQLQFAPHSNTTALGSTNLRIKQLIKEYMQPKNKEYMIDFFYSLILKAPLPPSVLGEH